MTGIRGRVWRDGRLVASDFPLADLDGHLADPGVLTWLDLEAPLFETYSRTHGKAKRSALERYDHEQGFRVKVATAASQGAPALVEGRDGASLDGSRRYGNISLWNNPIS